MAVAFDGETLIITLESLVVNIAWEDVYSDWKEWMLASPTNRRYPAAFRTTGGDPLNALLDAGSYFFLRNDYGWRIKPPEEDINILAIGNLAPEDATLDIFIPTVGAYTVLINGLQPITQGINLDFLTSITNMQALIETSRGHHASSGNIWHCSPANGDNNKDGRSEVTACQSIQYIHDNLVVSGNYDVIILHNHHSSGTTIIDEYVAITKSRLSIRGPGRGIVWGSASAESAQRGIVPGSATIYINSDEVELSGVRISTYQSPATYSVGIIVDGDFAWCHDLWFENCETYALSIQSSLETKNNTFERLIIDGNNIAGSRGIVVGNYAKYTKIRDVDIHDCTVSGIHIGMQPPDTESPLFTDLQSPMHIHGCGTGLNISLHADDTFLDERAVIEDNTLNLNISPSTDLYYTHKILRDNIAAAINVNDYKADVTGLATSADVAAVETKVDTIDGKVNTVDTLVDDLIKITGNKVTKSGDIITIYEANGVTVWRQYNLAAGERIQV